MQIKKHPDFLPRWKKLFFSYFIFFFISIGVTIYFTRSTGHTGLLWVLWPATMAAILYLALMPYLVKCPACGQKTKTKMSRKELPDHWSCACSGCDTIWDLDLGNSGD